MDRSEFAKKYQAALMAATVINLTGDINCKQMDVYIAQRTKILSSDKKESPIVITLTSVGGDIEWAWALVDDIQRLSEFREVLLLGRGKVSSAAVLILLALPLERRFLAERSTVYVHRRKTSFGDRLIGHDDAHEYAMKEHAATVANGRRIDEEWIHFMGQQTSIKAEGIRQLMEEPRFIVGNELVEMGFVSAIV